MTHQPRTIAIGDIHGELAHLDRLLERLPELGPEDTMVFIGDYVDRGPDSRGVVERVRALQRAKGPERVVCLRGNHEDKWIECGGGNPDAGFLLPPGNGCIAMFRSFTGGPPPAPDETLGAQEFARFIDVKSWLPPDVVAWFQSLPLWHEDEYALYVHAGLERQDDGSWLHPSEGASTPLMWQRDTGFFKTYEGKRLVFGHTPVELLPLDHLGFLASLFDDPYDVWKRGKLVGVDTGCGKGGFLSAVELPSLRIHESR